MQEKEIGMVIVNTGQQGSQLCFLRETAGSHINFCSLIQPSPRSHTKHALQRDIGWDTRGGRRIYLTLIMAESRIEQGVSFYNNLILKLMVLRGHIEKYESKCEPRELEFADIYDVQMHIILFQLDLAIVSKHFIVSYELKDMEEVNYFARAISVHLSDILQNTKNGVRSRINSVLKFRYQNPAHQELILQLNEKYRVINAIGNEHFSEIHRIRKTLFAHRDGSGMKQNIEMQKIDVMKLLFIGGEMHDTLSEIARLMCDFFLAGIKTVKPDDETTTSAFLTKHQG